MPRAFLAVALALASRSALVSAQRDTLVIADVTVLPMNGLMPGSTFTPSGSRPSAAACCLMSV